MTIPRFSSVDTVLFDFDGTLMDASSAICGAFRSSLDQDPAITDDQVRAMIGRPLREMFLTVRPAATSVEVDRLVDRYREAFLPLSASHTKPMPCAVKAVNRLAPVASLGIVTTRLTDGAIRMLRVHNMLDAFSCFIGLEHVDRVKPDPQPIERALELLGRSAQSTVMIGDTPDDVIAGRRAGTRTVGVTTGAYDRDALDNAGADWVIDSLLDLFEAIPQPT